MSELGTALLIIATIAALFTVRFPKRALALIQLGVLSLALAALIYARITNDFSIQNVAENSSRTLPLLYKITGSWGNHEGSMLLWVWVLAAYSAALTSPRRGEVGRGAGLQGAESSMQDNPHTIQDGPHPNPPPMGEGIKTMALRIQSLFAFSFLLFILFTSNPFAPVHEWVSDGNTLNPLLQDLGLAIHPPMLYLGYVGFSVVFSLAVAALIIGVEGEYFAKSIHPFILVAWSALTFGIGLGSWWAYRELGWGGWWFWDPVENASLLPWLTGTALLHSNLVLKKRGCLYAWVLLLAILTFAMSLLGTFLVRSGVLTSVHSFASDPARGIFILGLIGVSVGGALLLYGLKTAALTRVPLQFFSREGGIVLNNLFLVVICATILLGTLYPLLAEFIFKNPLTVGAPYYHKTVAPLAIIPLLLMAITPLIAWKRGNKHQLDDALPYMLAASACTLCLIYALALPHFIFAAIGMGIAAWVFSGSVALFMRHRTHLQPAILAAIVAHLGVSMLLAGITAESLWSEETEAIVTKGDTIKLGEYTLFYADESFEKRGNYITKIGTVNVLRDQHIITTLTPEYRFYPDAGITTSEASYRTSALEDIYVVIGESRPDGRTALRAYVKPLMSWIWAAFVMMALGGLIALRKKPSLRGTK